MAGKKHLDDRQIKFLAYYLDPNSETYSNALQSALKAGFSQEYSEVMVARDLEWVSEAVSRRARILNKAEKRLEELLDSADQRVVADIVKHTTKTLGREHYSERTELTGAGGKDLFVPTGEDKESAMKALATLDEPSS